MTQTKSKTHEKQKKKRFDLLHSMTADERQQFLKQEIATKEKTMLRLQQAAALDSRNQRIVIDLSFDDMMNAKELQSLAHQLKLCYGAMKQMEEPFQFIFCNPSGQLEHLLERYGASNWHVQWRRGAESVAEYFEQDQLVYLSPDSPNVLQEIDPEKIYIIGGIVDKSRKKGATLDAASEAGIATVRLPIQENILKRLDHILNVNTVVDVLINFRKLGDWLRVLEIALPQRKRSQIGRKAIRRRQKQQMLETVSATIIDTEQANDVACRQSHRKKTKQRVVVSAEKAEAKLSPTEDLGFWLENVAA